MKFLKIIPFLLALIILASCSNGSSSSSSSANTFTYKYNGSDVSITTIQAQKSEKTLVVSGTASDGQAIEFKFNKFGDLGSASSFSVTTASFPNSQNYMNYKSHYFTFNLISIDETAKRVHVTFTGNVYEDEYNLSSTSHPISGEFNVTYTDVAPTVAGLEVYCKIAGADWYSTSSVTHNGNSVDDFILDEDSDDENSIYLGFDSTNNGPGTYNFTTSSTTNFAKLVKFSPTTTEFTEYHCAGTVVVTSKTSAGFIGYYIEGTYSFTATNPTNSSDVIQVTNGRFKSYYSW